MALSLRVVVAWSVVVGCCGVLLCDRRSGGCWSAVAITIRQRQMLVGMLAATGVCAVLRGPEMSKWIFCGRGRKL